MERVSRCAAAAVLAVSACWLPAAGFVVYDQIPREQRTPGMTVAFLLGAVGTMVIVMLCAIAALPDDEEDDEEDDDDFYDEDDFSDDDDDSDSGDYPGDEIYEDEDFSDEDFDEEEEEMNDNTVITIPSFKPQLVV